MTEKADETKKRKFVRTIAKTKDEKQEEDEERPLKMARSDKNWKVSKGTLVRVLWPKDMKEVEFPCNAGIVLKEDTQETRWKGKFLALDSRLYVMELEGKLEEDSLKTAAAKKYTTPMYVAESIIMKSIPMGSSNSRIIFEALLHWCFRANTPEPWSDADVAQARRQHNSIDWSKYKDKFCLQTWLTECKSQYWADFMLRSPAVITYILCLHTSRLLQYYKLKHLEKLSVQERLALVKTLSQDPYLLCFKNLYEKEYPKLPELKLQNISPPMWRKIGMEKALNLWLYNALKVHQDRSQDTFVDFRLVGSRKVINLNNRATALQDLNARFIKTYLPMVCRTDEEEQNIALPNSLRGDFESIVSRLRQQGSIVLMGNRIILKSNWQATYDIVSCLRRFWHQPVEDHLTAAAAMANGHDMDDPEHKARMEQELAKKVDDFIASVLNKNTTESKSKPTEPNSSKANESKTIIHNLCEEQKNALATIQQHPITIVLGPGGSGKTELIMHLEGRGEAKWVGEQKFVDEHPDEFFTMAAPRYVKAKPVLTAADAKTDAKSGRSAGGNNGGAEDSKLVYYTKAHVLILTPTGAAANEIRKRTGIAAFTIDYFLTVFEHRVGLRRFDKVRIVVVDELSMVGEPIFARLLKVLVTLNDLRKLVLMGDKRQLPSISEGKLIADLTASFLPVIELRENHRAKPEAKVLFENAMAIAEGNMSKIKDVPGIFERRSVKSMSMETVYLANRQHLANSQIMCHTRLQRDFINRFWMEKENFLPPTPPVPLGGRADCKQQIYFPKALYKGYKFIFTKNRKLSLDVSVTNNQCEIVKAIYDTVPSDDLEDLLVQFDALALTPVLPSRQADRVEVESTNVPKSETRGRRVVVCESGLTFVCTAQTLAITFPAYAITVHSMQSRGIDRAYMWIEQQPNVFREMMYTASSRAKAKFFFVTENTDCTPKEIFDECCLKKLPERRTFLGEMLGKKASQWQRYSTSCVICNNKFMFTLEHSPDWPMVCDTCQSDMVLD